MNVLLKSATVYNLKGYKKTIRLGENGWTAISAL